MPLRCPARARAGPLLLCIHVAAAATIDRAHLADSHASKEALLQRCKPAELHAKDLDLVVYGATGFTGRLAAEYLAAWSPAGLRWAIAGRDGQKLEELRGELAPSTAGAPSILVADLARADTLLAMTQRTRAIMSYAGPYEKYGGEALIRAALQGCAHYADLAGEPPWKMAMLTLYGTEAAARGVALVQSVGADSLVPDVVALAAAEAVAEDNNGPPDELKVLVTENNGWFSGGTLASIWYSEAHHPQAINPYALVPESPPHARADASLTGMSNDDSFDKDFKTRVVPYFLAASDCAVIRRSLHLRFPGARISVSEGQTSLVSAKMQAFLMDPRMLIRPAPVLPKPGQGPPKWLQKKGSFVLTALARRRSDWHEVRVTLHGHGDMGYSGTAKMSAELALGLALSGPADGRGGYLTPATVLGPGGLQHRLEQAEGGKFMTFSRA